MTRHETYSELNLELDLIVEGASNRSGKAIKPEYVTIHNTDNTDAGADARAHARYIKGPEARRRRVSWHYTVDDTRVVKHLPLYERGLHTGTRAGNDTSVGIEICVHAGIDEAKANRRAVLLTALLLDALELPMERVVPHRFWSGKECPSRLLAPERWSGFLSQVGEFLEAF